MIDKFRAICSGWVLPKKQTRRKRAIPTEPEEPLNYEVYAGITHPNGTEIWLLVSFGNNATSSPVVHIHWLIHLTISKL